LSEEERKLAKLSKEAEEQVAKSLGKTKEMVEQEIAGLIEARDALQPIKITDRSGKVVKKVMARRLTIGELNVFRRELEAIHPDIVDPEKAKKLNLSQDKLTAMRLVMDTYIEKATGIPVEVSQKKLDDDVIRFILVSGINRISNPTGEELNEMAGFRQGK